MNQMKTILPLILLASGASLGCAFTGDDGSPDRTASVAQAIVYTPVMDSGWNHSCAGKSDGTVYCWGHNNLGQVGDGSSGNYRTTPVLVSGITGPVSLALGQVHSCAADSNGDVYCWGYGGTGVLGNGGYTNYPTPHLVPSVPGFSNIFRVSAGYQHTCALTSTGDPFCWGVNVSGQVGDGTMISIQPAPVPVALFTGGTKQCAAAISAGGFHTCAVVIGGTVQCWGQNDSGQLGDGTTTLSRVPVQVLGITDAIGITTGVSHSCALLSTGKAKCWGKGTEGQLGNGSTTAIQSTPVFVSGITGIVRVEAGTSFTCAQLGNGTAKCWGSNGTRNLGDGTTTQQNTGVLVSGVSSGVDISAGAGFACSLLTGGGVQCWGDNTLGQLGDGTTTSSSAMYPVTTVIGLP